MLLSPEGNIYLLYTRAERRSFLNAISCRLPTILYNVTDGVSRSFAAI